MIKNFFRKHYLNLGAGLIILIILGLSGAIIWKDRQAARQQAQQSAQNLLATLSRDLSGDFENLDLSLRGVVRDAADPDIQRLPPEVRHRVMFDNAVTSDYLGSIVVINDLGEIIADAASLTPRQAYLADREYFQRHKHEWNLGRYLSLPFESRFRDGELRVSLTRRISNADGSFAGVASLGIPLARISERLERLNIGRAGSISLLRNDGILLVRQPFNRTDVGRDLSSTPNVERFMREGSGHFVGTAALDGVSRLYTFGRVGTLPLILTVSLSVDEVLADWRNLALIQSALTGLVCLAVIGLTFFFQRELTRRQKAETRLASLARTDDLTNLPNRRAFHEQLEQEWRQAIRSKAALSVLYMDADYFKKYNDRYGHSHGDELLFALGQTLKANLRPPRDLAARYGGEEFVALLPETDKAGALAAAENVRQAVMNLDIPHEQSPFRFVTISIGVATAYPSVGGSGDAISLIRAADGALYQAKEAGRNCVREPSPSQSASNIVPFLQPVGR